MQKKLLLINPAGSDRPGGFQTCKVTRFQPLGLGIVAALTPKNWDVEIIDEIINEIVIKDVDLVALSAFTPNVSRAYEIAAKFKEKGIHTVLGGIHGTLMIEEALLYFDTVAAGEAEKIWKNLISDFEKGEIKRVYGPEFADMENIPMPRRDLFDPSYFLASIQTTRGCPMDCNFCSVSIFNGNAYRKRPIEQVLDELETIPQKYVFFVDDNLIGNTKEHHERARELFKGMIERKINKKWICQTSISVADNEETLDYAYKAGCRIMLIGIESEKADGLEFINKRLNKSKLNDYGEIFKKIHKSGIAILGAFIFGLDTDNLQDLNARAEFIRKWPIDLIQATILTPLPGTRMYKSFLKDNRITRNNYPKDWCRYTFIDVVFSPQNITEKELLETVVKINYSLYSYSNIIKKFFMTFRETGKFFTAFWALKFNLVYRKAVLSSYDFDKSDLK